MAGIAGRTAATLWEKFACGLFPLVSSAGLWAHPQVWMSREGMAVPEELDVPICAPVGAGHASSIPLPNTHSVAGLAGSCVTHVCDCLCLEGCFCDGCSQGALRMLIFYLIYSREGV